MTRQSPEIQLGLSGVSGLAVVRAGGEADAIDGVQPRVVVEPASAEAVAALLAWASREQLSVVLRGNGTKLGWGRTPTEVDLVVGTRRLNRVLAHQHGDLTATVEGGATLAEFNRELARHGQWLPVDVSFDDATIGGTIAAGDSGPCRHRHGTARDLLIGVRLATADGRLVKAGGNVVKNVAGYDLGKLMSGSFGALAAIAGATFKLAPSPTASGTVRVAFSTADALARAATAVGASQIEPVALDVSAAIGSMSDTASGVSRSTSRPGPGYRLLVRFASTPDVVGAQIEETRRLLGADRLDVLSGQAEDVAWRSHRDVAWGVPGATIKLSWLPASLPSVLTLVHGVGALGVRSVSLVGRAGVGVGVVNVDGDPATQVRAIECLRADKNVGNVVVLRAEPSVKARVDVWGVPSDAAALMRSVKRALDPAGVLNAGRGPV